MNIFYLNNNPELCAKYHVDRHVVKQVLEYSQILSTAHRVLDGTHLIDISDSGRKVSRWILDDNRNDLLYKATHINHPSTLWARQSSENYMWLAELLSE